MPLSRARCNARQLSLPPVQSTAAFLMRFAFSLWFTSALISREFVFTLLGQRDFLLNRRKDTRISH